ncbi:hypothetical protein MLD38_034017 [Melastoma candidum]|uniref:Uncharacterized protein n=1 Tax=Melastoma candidum TaxID=119954 RepID=A0ACB9M8E5_9MYRT|nr:hypothetical protein MLD38_034017 [Melastoma candidum]
MMFPDRPRCKTFERRCMVKANHFFLEASQRDLHHYCMNICLEGPQMHKPQRATGLVLPLPELSGEPLLRYWFLDGGEARETTLLQGIHKVLPADEDGGLYDQALVGCHTGEQGRKQDPRSASYN